MTKCSRLLGCITLAVVATCWGSSALGAGQSRRYLFLDPGFIEQSQGTALRVNRPESSEIVIRPDRPWEKMMINLYLTVREEEGKLRMWYICRDAQSRPNVAYAESEDGLHWTKPNLGIVEYEGSRENNLVGMTSLEGVVFQDPNAPPAERYAYVTHVFGEGMVRYFSPDGLQWERDAVPLLRLGADTQNVTLWDARLGRYVLFLRGWRRAADKKRYRKVVRATVASLTSPMPEGPSAKSQYLWGKDEAPVIDDEFPTVLAADDRDPPDTDVYNMSAQIYPIDSRWYVGFPSFFLHEGSTSNGRLEVQFVGSRDGITWHRYDRSAYAEPGLEGSPSANMVYMGTGLVMRGDEIWQYGTGFRTKHGDVEGRRRKTDGVIFRYVQRVDGFVSLDFDLAGGQATTRAVKIDGTRLLLNVDTGALGSLRAGLLDAEGKPIPGFGVDECRVIRTNSTTAEVSWEGQNDLSPLAGREIKLTFSGSRAKLYSFRFD